MTESEWLACLDPKPMLDHICSVPGFTRHKATRRKLRLYGCACCRLVWDQLLDPRSRVAVEAAENFADGGISLAERQRAQDEAWRARNDIMSHSPGLYEAEALHDFGWSGGAYYPTRAALLAWAVLDNSYRYFACAGLDNMPRPTFKDYDVLLDRRSRQAQALHCICGNPFRPTALDPAWRTWNGGTVLTLARAIYEDRELPSGHLDPVRLALLADMLEDAGTSDPHILEHLRGPGPHVRGCWALDLVLGKQ